MNEAHHYPPDLMALLVDTIPVLCRGKKDVVLFFRGAGVADEDLAPMVSALNADPTAISKAAIARHVLAAINGRGDSGLGARREVLKRVVEFEEFSTCWPTDQLKAKGLVSDVRKVVNTKDAFTRMKQERDREHQAAAEVKREAQVAASSRKAQIDSVRDRLYGLFAMDDKPHARGKDLERVLNDLFRAYGLLVKEDFKRRDLDGSDVLEQIDGVIEFDGTLHLVEMKWLKEPVGVAHFAPHVVRLFNRASARGIFISASEFTAPVVKECAGFLNQRTMFLCSLKEIVLLLQRQGDLAAFLKTKSQAAILDKNPFLEVLS